MRIRSGIVLSIAAVAALTACGGGGDGGGDGESSPSHATSAAAPRSVDYQLARLSDLGLREAFVTLTGRTDGKTMAVVDFYVPREGGANDDLYPTAIRAGGCPDAGAVEHDLGPLAAGTSVIVVDAAIDDLATSLDHGDVTVAILSPDGQKVAWCGP